MTIPRISKLYKNWNKHPPVGLMLESYFGITKRNNENEVSIKNTTNNDITKKNDMNSLVDSLGGNGFITRNKINGK
jgi:hypothetical protein